MTQRAWLGRPECGATTTSGDPCKQPAGAGTLHRGVGHCAMHLGRTAAHNLHAVREVIARSPITPIEIDPGDALLMEVHRCAGIVAWLGHFIEWLSERDQLVQGEAISPWMTMFQQERDRLVKSSESALRAGVAERKVRIVEQQGVLIAEALRRVFHELDLSPAQAQMAPTLMRRHLTAIAAASYVSPTDGDD